MQFYIYQNSSWVEKKAQLLAIQEDAKDETLDTACVQLFFDEQCDPYAPRTLCKMVYKDNSVESGQRSVYYFIATDNTAIQTLSPKTYKHTLTLVQTTRKLSHYVLPNMIVTKPREAAVSTYFANENVLNPLYFTGHAYEPTAPANFKGFVSHSYYNVNGDKGGLIYESGLSDSLYWIECTALSKHTKAQKARIKVSFTAMQCEVNIGSNGYATSGLARPIKLLRNIACPSWLTPYLVVYWSSENVNQVENDSEITKVQIAKVELSSVSWTDEFGYVDLDGTQLDLLNSYDSGYIACEIISEATGKIPSELYDEQEKKYYKGCYSRLFTDISEFTNNGIQAIWSNVSLEITYQETTLYDVLQRIIDRQQCKHASSANEPLFYLPTNGDDYETLINTESPEFSFNNLTVFEAVSQVLETIDALPRFDSDDNGKLTLGLDYFASTGTSVKNTAKFSSYISNQGEQRRDNGVLTTFQNAESVCHFPCKPFKGEVSYARANVTSYGIPTLSDFVLAVDKPIKYIKHLWVRMTCSFDIVYETTQSYEWGDKIYSTYNYNTYIPIDIASYIFDDSTYSSALDQGSDYPNKFNYSTRMQMNCLRFKQGEKNIKIGNKGTTQWNWIYSMFHRCCLANSYRFYGIKCINSSYKVGEPDWSAPWAYKITPPTTSETDYNFKNVWFCCEYVSAISGRLEVQSPFPKEEGQFISSTSTSSPDLGKLGLNMLGIALRSGEPTMTCTQMLTSWENRIKVGYVFTRNNEKWIATKASYTALCADTSKEVIKGTIEFTKNFNGLSKRIAIDQSKRLYNIDRSISDLCEVNVTQYVYFEPKPNKGSFSGGEGNDIVFDLSKLAHIVMRPFTNNQEYYANVSFALLKSPTIDGARYIPLSVYGSGNCLCFETKYSDPISCGIQMIVKGTGDTGLWWLNGAAALVGSNYYNGSDVKYCDDEGYSDTFSISYYANKGNMKDFSDTFPIIDEKSVNGIKCGEMENLTFNKQPNEIFGANFELAFLSRYHLVGNEVFFGREFFNTWNEIRNRKTTKLRYYLGIGASHRYDYSSTKGKGTYLEGGEVTAVYGESKSVDLVYSYSPKLIPLANYKVSLQSFALCDQDGNILIACNCEQLECYYIVTKGKAAVSVPSFHFFARQERL